VHDIAATHVDAMVGKGKPRCNEVRAQRRFFRPGEKPVTSAKRD